MEASQKKKEANEISQLPNLDDVSVADATDEDDGMESDDSDSSDTSSQSASESELEQQFITLESKPNKKFRDFVELSCIAYKLNDFDRQELVFTEFDRSFVIPSCLWLRYLKCRYAVTQTASERAIFEEKCIKALSTFYNPEMAEFILDTLLGQNRVENPIILANLISDYCVERADLVYKIRLFITKLNSTDAAELMQLMGTYCITWYLKPEQLLEITKILSRFRSKLEESTDNWSEFYNAAIDDVLKQSTTLDDNIKCAMIKVIFERCINLNCAAEVLWMAYIEFESGENPKTAFLNIDLEQHTRGYLQCIPMDLARRALCIKPTVKLCRKFLNLMEKADCSLAQVDRELSAVFTKMKNDIEMTVELHLDYLAYRIRRTNYDLESECNNLRAVFRYTWSTLSEQYGARADTSYEVLQLWAQTEYTHLKCPAQAHAIWHEILNYEGSYCKSQLWLTYIHMEIAYNNSISLGQIIANAAMQDNMDNMPAIASEYNRYERCFGADGYVDMFENICKNYKIPYNNNPKPVKTIKTNNGKKQLSPVKRVAAPKIQPLKTIATLPPRTEPKHFVLKYSNDMEENKIFINNLPANYEKAELNSIFNVFGHILDTRIIFKPNQNKSFAYIEFEKPEQAYKAVIEANNSTVGGKTISVAISKPPPKLRPMTRTFTSTKNLPGGPRRKMQTTLIPTTLVRQVTAAKRQRVVSIVQKSASELEAERSDAAAVAAAVAAVAAANEEANKKESEDDLSSDDEPCSFAAALNSQKTNDDFRKLFNL